MKRYLQTIFRNFWNLPVLYALIFVFLLAATFFLEALLALRSFPSIWERYPLLFFLLKLAAALFLFSLMFQQLKRLPISKNGSFYSASTLLFFLIDTALMAVFNLSFSYYFLWAFLFSFLFSILRIRALKFLAVLISPYWLIKATVDIFSLPELAISHVLLFSRLQGNLLLAFFTLPFLLMLIRIDFLIRHPIKGKRSFAINSLSFFTGFFTIGVAAFLFTYQPFDTASPQPVHIAESLDTDSGEHYMELSSPAPLGDFSLRRGNEIYSASTRERSYRFALSSPESVFELSARSSSFLDRDLYRLSYTAKKIRPGMVNLKLIFPREPLLYDSNFPYAIDPQNRSIDIFIGKNPPSPLIVELAFPHAVKVEAQSELFFDTLPEECSFIEGRFAVETSFVLKETLILKQSDNS